MVNNYQVPTPRDYVLQMLDYIGYDRDLYGKKVLENSCGEGNILVEIVKRYIEDARANNISDQCIIAGLERDITAFETDIKKLNNCIKRLDAVLEVYGLDDVSWNIVNQDFLTAERSLYSFVIGNPPYITYHNLTEEQRRFVRRNFSTCESGRFDYCYAFIQASIESLEQGGKMIYLVPCSIMKNKFAEKLRKFLLPYVTAIYDYKSIKIFTQALTSSIFLMCENRQNDVMLQYHFVANELTLQVDRNDLKEKWDFCVDANHAGNCFKDHFEISNSVATLYNAAFILQDYGEDEEYILKDGFKIEKQLVRTAVSTKSLNKKEKNKEKTDKDLAEECKEKKKSDESRIIFPYRVVNGKVDSFEEKEFCSRFPEACRYLKHFSDELEKRKKDEKAKWFEYGRSQALKNVLGEKLIIPMVITKSVKVYCADAEAIPYAGYFVKCRKGSSLTLEDAKRILQSKEFYDYVTMRGTPTTTTSYRISVNDIKEYKF